MKKSLLPLLAVAALLLASSGAGRADSFSDAQTGGYWVPAPQTPSAPAQSQAPQYQQVPPSASYYGNGPGYAPGPYYAGPPPYYYGPPPVYYGPRYYGPGPGVHIFLPGIFFGFGFHGHHR
jgi:hypothetical protein